MKKILFVLTIALVIASCSASKVTTAGRQEQRKEKKLAEQTAIKQAIESRNYIIKANRIYKPGGGFVDLMPKMNYIIVNGEIASISLGYIGRSFGVRQITGLNFNGHTIKYELVSKETKGMFQVNMKVAKGSDTFDFYITIAPSGTCTFSVTNPYIQTVNYNGEVVPVNMTGNHQSIKDQTN